MKYYMSVIAVPDNYEPHTKLKKNVDFYFITDDNRREVFKSANMVELNKTEAIAKIKEYKEMQMSEGSKE